VFTGDEEADSDELTETGRVGLGGHMEEEEKSVGITDGK
jgi:hypothetical protein